MENTNSNPEEVKTAPEASPSTGGLVAGEVKTAPEAATATPAASAPAVVAPATTPAPAAQPTASTAPLGPVELPKTTGTTPGGWNRFATPKKPQAKFNSNRRDGGSRGGR
jgi:hypothetical protein